jgi:hypothetical protein
MKEDLQAAGAADQVTLPAPYPAGPSALPQKNGGARPLATLSSLSTPPRSLLVQLIALHAFS